MRFEWFIKQILASINGKTDINYTILTPERSTSVDGVLRYVGDTVQIYVGENRVFVDTPVYVFDTAMVLRAECPIVNDETAAAIIRATYASGNVFLKALFFHSVETAGQLDEISNYYNCVRIGIVAVVRHFCQDLVDVQRAKAYRIHSSDLLSGWLGVDMVDTSVHLRFSAHPDTGNIVFHDPNAELRPDDMTKYGWLTIQAVPYQAAASKDTVAETTVTELCPSDLRLMYNAGCGREIRHWDLAVNALALPSLKSLIK